MEGLNEVRLFGTLGADPVLKNTQGGTSVLRLRLATGERFKDKNGEWTEQTEWHNVVVFGARTEGLNKILAKGSTILVTGSLHTSSYEDRDGVKRYSTDVIAHKVLLGSKPNCDRSDPPQSDLSGSSPSVPHPDDTDDDELPF